MFGLSSLYLRLIGIGALVIACLSLAYVVNGWRDDSKALAVERSQYRKAVDGFNEQIRQVQEQEQKSREASNAYQAKLNAANAQLAAANESNRGLQITARRRIPAVVITAGRLDAKAPEPERDTEYAIPVERFTEFAAACQADAELALALQGWILAR